MPGKVPQAKTDSVIARRQQVADLRVQQLTLAEIAERLDVSVTTVHFDMKAVREMWIERATADHSEMVAEQIAKLDALERTLMPDALKGDLKVVEQILKIIDRRSKILGLDQPQRHEVQMVSIDLIDAEIRRLREDMDESERQAVDIELAGGDDAADR